MRAPVLAADLHRFEQWHGPGLEVAVSAPDDNLPGLAMTVGRLDVAPGGLGVRGDPARRGLPRVAVLRSHGYFGGPRVFVARS